MEGMAQVGDCGIVAGGQGFPVLLLIRRQPGQNLGCHLLGGAGGQLTRQLGLRPEEIPYVLPGEGRDDETTARHEADKALAPKGEQTFADRGVADTDGLSDRLHPQVLTRTHGA